MPNETLAITLAVTTALAVTAFAVLVGLGLPGPARPAAASIPATCLEWTDGCTICVRTPQGPACSTPGIACIREAPICVRP